MVVDKAPIRSERTARSWREYPSFRMSQYRFPKLRLQGKSRNWRGDDTTRRDDCLHLVALLHRSFCTEQHETADGLAAIGPVCANTNAREEGSTFANLDPRGIGSRHSQTRRTADGFPAVLNCAADPTGGYSERPRHFLFVNAAYCTFTARNAPASLNCGL